MSTCKFDLSTDPSAARIWVGDTDVSEVIRGPEVTAAVSAVAADPEVRELAVAAQRAIIEASEPGIVVEGRDITTVVAPDADVKIFLTADQTVREARRAAEFADPALAARMRASVGARDQVDVSREHSPLRKSDGVTLLDATNLSLSQVVDTVIQLVKQSRGGGHA